MLFTEKLPGYIFQQLFFPGEKATAVFVRELLALLCVHYHANYTEVTWYIFQQLFSPGEKVIAVFIRQLSALRFVNYHVIYIEVIGVRFSTTFFSKVKSYRSVCTYVIRSAVHKLSCDLHKSYRRYIFNKFSLRQSYRGVCT